MKSDKNIVGWVGSGVAGVFTALQENPVIQVISFCLTILSVLVSLAYTLWKWYRRAKADKKITEEEVEEGLQIIKDHTDILPKQKGKEK